MRLDFLERHIRLGSINVHLPDGRVHRLGAGEPAVDWHIHRRGTIERILRDPELALGETYMDGDWSVGPGELRRLLEVLSRNFSERATRRASPPVRLLLKLLQQLNGVRRSHRNVAHHYDLDEALFRTFLDRGMNYSCGYFQRPGITLEEAQEAKLTHIRRKLLLSPGQRVLDIGSGWGSLAIHLARHADVEVVGVTLSREQLRAAREHAEQAGVADRVHFLLQDYREHRSRYDRVVSVGMFEHVGSPNHRTFFARVRDLLHDDGIALLHTIGSSGPPTATTNAFIRRYIFPGGSIPALSEVSTAIEHCGLVSCDVEVLRLHYAETLAAWAERFRARRAEVAERMGERFCRMWEFYLDSCEVGFRWWDLVVYQFQLALRNDATPLTRDYMYRPDEVRRERPKLSAAKSA